MADEQTTTEQFARHIAQLLTGDEDQLDVGVEVWGPTVDPVDDGYLLQVRLEDGPVFQVTVREV